MINIAARSFNNGSFPATLIKSIDIELDGATLMEQMTRFKFTADISLQTPAGQEINPCGILVVAIFNQGYLSYLKTTQNSIKGLIKDLLGNGPKVHDLGAAGMAQLIGVNGISESPGGLVSYSEQQSSLVATKTVKAAFAIPSRPNNLSLFVVSYRASSLGLSDETVIIGRPIIETVLRNGKPPLTSRLFRLLKSGEFGKRGELWVGPVHRSQQGLFAGQVRDPGADVPPRIKTTQITNQKIKDHRIKLAIDRLPLAITNNSVNRTGYFGAVHYSRDLTNEVGIMIPFNLDRYIKENFYFSGLIINEESLLSCGAIEDIKIFRSRTQNNHLSSKLTSDKSGPGVDCYKIPPTLIGTLKNGQVSLLELPGTENRISHIFVKDKYMADAKLSRFQYSVEITLVDNTRSAIAAVLEKLSTALYNYESYLFALRGDGRPMGEDYATFMSVNAQNLTVRQDWKALIVEFISAIRFIYGTQNTLYASGIEWAHKMLPLANPYSATLESASELKEMIGGYYGRLNSLYKKTITQKSEAPHNVNQKISSAGPTQRRLKLEYFIKQSYYNDLESSTGFDYLGEFSPPISTRFRTISHAEYLSRASAEMTKYGLTGPSSQGINQYGFLSPRFVRLPSQTITTSIEMPLFTSYDLYQANLYQLTREKNFLGNPASFDNESALVNRILNQEGVSYNKLKKPLATVAQENTSAPIAELDSSLYFGDTGAFIFDNETEETAVHGSSIPAYKESLLRSVDLINNGILVQTVNDAISDYRPTSSRDIEKIQGSFAYQQLKFDPEALASMNLFEIEINYNSVVKIEYLSGYNGSANIPVWQLLTRTQLASINSGESSSYLCRITEVDSLFTQPNIFKLPSFNQYFVLGSPLPTTAMGLQSSYKEAYASINTSTQALMTIATINTNTVEATCFPQYTLSSAMIYGQQRQSPAGQEGL